MALHSFCALKNRRISNLANRAALYSSNDGEASSSRSASGALATGGNANEDSQKSGQEEPKNLKEDVDFNEVEIKYYSKEQIDRLKRKAKKEKK